MAKEKASFYEKNRCHQKLKDLHYAGRIDELVYYLRRLEEKKVFSKEESKLIVSEMVLDAWLEGEISYSGRSVYAARAVHIFTDEEAQCLKNYLFRIN